MKHPIEHAAEVLEEASSAPENADDVLRQIQAVQRCMGNMASYLQGLADGLGAGGAGVDPEVLDSLRDASASAGATAQEAVEAEDAFRKHHGFWLRG